MLHVQLSVVIQVVCFNFRLDYHACFYEQACHTRFHISVPNLACYNFVITVLSRNTCPCVLQDQLIIDRISDYFKKDITSIDWADEDKFVEVLDKTL